MPASTSHDQINHLHTQLLEHLDRGDDLSSLMELLSAAEALPDHLPNKPSLITSARHAISVSQRLKQHQQKERALHAVFESAQALTELKDLDSVLLNIVERGRNLLGSDLAWLAGSNVDDPHFRVLAIDGASTESSKNMSAPPNAGIAAHVAKTRLPFTSSQYLSDESFSHDAAIDSTLGREGLESVAAVPLLTHNDVTGILIVGNRYKRTYQPWEISILTALAAHASIAIRNAHAYSVKQQALHEAKSANLHLEEKISALELAADADVRLTQQLTKGAGPQEMVEVIAAILQGNVVFFDAAGRALCTSTPEFHVSTSEVDNDPEPPKLLASIRTALNQSFFLGRSIPVETDTHEHCRTVAVLSGDDHLGSLLIQRGETMSDDEVRIFERCATAMAVVALLTDRKSISARQEVQLTVRALLDKSQHGSADLRTRAKLHGLDITAPAIIAVVSIPRVKSALFLRKLTDALRQYPHIGAEVDGQLIIIANRSDPLGMRQELADAAPNDGDVDFVGCVSRTAMGPSELANAYSSAKRAIQLLYKLDRMRCFIYEPQVSVYAALFQPHSASALSDTIHATIGELISYDEQRGTQLRETLLSFLENKQNVSATARHLGIHVNTMHKRLETIDNIIGHWNERGRTVEIHIALQLWQLKHGTQDLI